MKYNTLKKSLCLVACLFLIIQIFSVATYAAKEEYVEWTVSQDGERLLNSNKTYELYIPEIDIRDDAKNGYYYYNMIKIEERQYRVHGSSDNSEFVWIYDKYNYPVIYATEKGTDILDSFISGENVIYYLRNGDSKDAKIDEALIGEMNNAEKLSGNKKTVNVRELRDINRLDIKAYDETDTFYYTYGALYELSDGKYYYLSYRDLSNQYFDADGNFSYRRGSVTLTELDDSAAVLIKRADASREIRVYKSVYEGYDVKDSDDYSLVSFYIVYIFFGFLIPVAPLFIGLMLPRSKKLGYPRYWYILAWIGAIWILLSAILLVVLILA